MDPTSVQLGQLVGNGLVPLPFGVDLVNQILWEMVVPGVSATTLVLYSGPQGQDLQVSRDCVSKVLYSGPQGQDLPVSRDCVSEVLYSGP